MENIKFELKKDDYVIGKVNGKNVLVINELPYKEHIDSKTGEKVVDQFATIGVKLLNTFEKEDGSKVLHVDVTGDLVDLYEEALEQKEEFDIEYDARFSFYVIKDKYNEISLKKCDENLKLHNSEKKTYNSILEGSMNYMLKSLFLKDYTFSYLYDAFYFINSDSFKTNLKVLQFQ